MTTSQKALLWCTWFMAMVALATGSQLLLWPESLPIVSNDEVETYVHKCREVGGVLTSAAYVSQQRAIFVCSTWDKEGKEVVIDVYFK